MSSDLQVSQIGAPYNAFAMSMPSNQTSRSTSLDPLGFFLSFIHQLPETIQNITTLRCTKELSTENDTEIGRIILENMNQTINRENIPQKK